MIRKALTAILLAGLLLGALGVAAQGAEKRIALVIGNAKYPQTPLTNPVNDAQDIAKALKDCGFDVTLRTDCTKAQMDEAIQELGRKVKGGGIALFYYAGHGFQTSDNKNYLMPVDAAWSGESEAKLRCYEAEMVMAILEDAQARMNLIILDCCRDNPFTRSFRSSNAGLAAMTPPTDSVLVFSAAPGQRALDGQDRNSPFAKSLLRHVSSPGVELEELLMRVSAEVKNSALPHKQEPWRQTNRTSSFYFIPGSGASAAPGPVAALPPAPPAAPSLLGHLQVAVNAPAARVQVDGAQKGMASPEKPLNLEGLLAGKVKVRVDAEGYEPLEKVVEVTKNEWTQEEFILSKVIVIQPTEPRPPTVVTPTSPATPLSQTPVINYTPAWIKLTVNTSPPPRQGASVSYDSGRNEAVIFGGVYAHNSWRSDTWVWSNRKWRCAATSGPSPRSGAAMAYDQARGKVILFGGESWPMIHEDTWEWDGKQWTEQRVSGPSPRAWMHYGMVYDEFRERIVLHGGSSGFSDTKNDTWEWDGRSWRQVSQTGPPRRYHLMCFDKQRKRTVLWGGINGETPCIETWEWDGRTWECIVTDGPPQRYGGVLVYQPHNGRALLHGGGGHRPSGERHDTWEWTGKTWEELKLTSPPAYSGAAAFYDISIAKVIYFGGTHGHGWDDVSDETWTFGS